MAAQFVIMPAATVVLVWLFELPPELAIGVILVGTCPGGTASNVISYLARGDVALSAPSLAAVAPIMALAVVLHNLFGLALGHAAARLFGMDSRRARTVSIEVGMQNSGLAASLAVLYFNPAAAIPGAIFSVWQNVSGSLVASFYRKRDERKALLQA